MSDESSFEFVNKKAELEIMADNTANNAGKIPEGSTWLAGVQPPTDLPSFVVKPEKPTNAFHPTSFSPAIPENKAVNAEPSVKEDESEITAGGLFDWVKDTVGNKGGTLFTKVAEKAKSSVGSVITALDPQMRDLISNVGTPEVIVISEKEVEVSPIREAFQFVFNKSFVRGLGVDEVSHAKQIVGFESALKVAMLKVESIRNRHSVGGLVIAIQNFIVELQEEKWYDMDLIFLSDLEKSQYLETYTQMIPVPYSVVNVAKDDTPKDYEFKNEGFAYTVGHVIGSNLQVHPSEWQETLTGLSRRERILSAAKVLINLYKNTLL